MIVFVGPSLRDTAPWRDGLAFAGPAKCGDILRAVEARPRAIGLVDGCFETTAAPWHKEILFALSAGIAMFGAASIGALRAAEMAPFGMVGIGRVFELYRDGAIEADDEVAVLHGPAEAGYPPLTVPLVNIRATLARAVAAAIVDDAAADAILAAAKMLFYKDRTWPAVLAAAGRGAAGERFRAWLPGHAVDRKALDAAAMIEAMLAWSASGARAARPAFVRTHLFAALEATIAPAARA